MGGGDMVGPDLLGVVARRDRAWLERWLKVPDQMLAEKDPLAMELYEKYNQLAMPNLELNDIDVRDLMEFMQRDGRPLASAPGAISGTEPTAALQ
jgi:protein SCO1/2